MKKLLLAGGLLVWSTLLFAQQTQSDSTQPPASTPDTPVDTPSDSPPAVDPDVSDEPVDGAENQTTGRFIPTEQISQDLGVSFPVDI